MNSTPSDTEAWIAALLERQQAGDASTAGAELSGSHAGANKLFRVLRAFAALQHNAPTTPSMNPQPRFHWRHLAVLERLGAGGYGEVFRAYDSVLERDVALKLRRANHQFSVSAGRAFIDEARRLAQVRHPNVLAVHGAAIDQGRAGIWTDLLSGETLATRVSGDGPMGFPALLALATDLAAALTAVHAQAIVHGDLKPANVMCEAGKDGAYVLMDFGAGAQLDAQGRARLYAGTLNFMAPEHLGGQAIGTAADIYALGACMVFAATGKPDLKGLRARADLPKAFSSLFASMLAPTASARPSAAFILGQCQLLLAAPERRKRRRLQWALWLVLSVAVLIALGALVLSLRARASAEMEAHRATTTKDFLLSMMRNTNPYQSPNPTRSVATFFANAVAELPKAFADDPKTEALLLNQFGRTLIVLDQDALATSALLRADQLLATAGVGLNDELRIDTRSYLGNTYRMRREYAKAIALSAEQSALCAAGNALPVRTCIAIINDRVQALGFGGNLTLALHLVDENLARVEAAHLQADDRAAAIYLMQGTMRRELGLSADARRAFVRFSDMAIKTFPQKHPVILTNLSWLAWSADDLADATLARKLNSDLRRTGAGNFTAQSHYTAKLAIQTATLALHAQDFAAARAHAQQLIQLLPKNESIFAPYIEQATMILALADGDVSDLAIDAAVQSRQAALGESAVRLAELRLGMAAVALRRGQVERARQLIAQTKSASTNPEASGVHALYWCLRYHLDLQTSPHNLVSAKQNLVMSERILAQQQKQMYDPVSAGWIGAPVLNAPQYIAEINAAAERIIANHYAPAAQHSP
jgi:serine/threonine protein kinase